MSLHYLVKYEIAICGTHSVIVAISVTLLKFLAHSKRKSSARVQQSKCSKCRPLARTRVLSAIHQIVLLILYQQDYLMNDTALLHVGPNSDQTLLQFVDIMYCGPASAPIFFI